MQISRSMLLAVAMAFTAPVIAQNALPTQPGLKSQLSTQAAPHGRVTMDEVTRLKMEIGRLQKQMEEMRQQMQQISQAQERLQNQHASHYHTVQGNAVPVRQFAGEAVRHYHNGKVLVSNAQPQTGRPQN